MHNSQFLVYILTKSKVSAITLDPSKLENDLVSSCLVAFMLSYKLSVEAYLAISFFPSLVKPILTNIIYFYV
jgi:hypothetical protein